MPKTPKKTPKAKPNQAEDQRERGYYYDDAHGYETYDPAKENDDEASGSGPFDVDLDRTPPLLIETDEAEKKSREMPDEDSDPDVDRP